MASPAFSPVKAFVDSTYDGIATSFHSSTVRQGVVEHSRLIHAVDDGRRKFAVQSESLEKLRSDTESAKDQLSILLNERDNIIGMMEAARDSRGSLAAADRLAKLGTLKQALDVSEKAIRVQQKKLHQLDERLHKDEHDIVEDEVALTRKVERVAAAEREQQRRLELQREAALARVQAESKSAETLTRHVFTRTVSDLQAEVAAADEAGQIYATSRRLHNQAAATLAASAADRTAVVAAATAMRRDAITGRAQAVLSLKANLDQVSSEAQAANARRIAANERKQAKQDAEYADLLAQGYNPYEVWRARDRDAHVMAEVRQHEESVAAARLKVASKVIAEDEKVRRLENARREEKKVEDEYKRSISRPVRESATTAYIMDRTKGHTDSMDPTGRIFRVEPRQATVVKPAGFGLGNVGSTRPDIVAKVAAKRSNAAVELLPQWMPKELPDPDAEPFGSAGAARRSTSPPSGVRGAGNGASDRPDGGAATLEDDFDADDGAGDADRRESGSPAAYAQPQQKKYQLRHLSKYEQRLMAQAKDRQRNNIVKAQVVFGKEYKGAGFLPSPAVLHFKDFTVGEPYTLKFTLTNVSLSFNSFKLIHLPDEIRDLFTIVHTPPGRMSAGTSCPLTITFLPRQDVDIHTTLDILAQTGPISIPLHCTTKKALPVCRSPVLDIGEVVLGEAGSGHFVISNEGALPLKLTITRDADTAQLNGSDEEPDRALDGDAVLAEAITVASSEELAGYGSVKIPVHFAPTHSGYVHVPITVSFDNPSVQPMQLLIKATGMDVPLYVESDLLDLQTCLTGKLYRGTLVVRNRGTMALRCVPHVHPGCVKGGVLGFHPTTGFVQARDSATNEPGRFEFQVKFRPSDDLLERHELQSCKVRDSDTDGADVAVDGKVTDVTALALAPLLEIPLEVTAPDQVLPVPFVLRARITTPEIVLAPETFDFGPCLIGQAASLPLTITNKSAMPQRFGFVKLPPCFTVGPGAGDGIGMLLPGETISTTVAFTPAGVQDFSAGLVCRTTTSCEYRVAVAGSGVRGPLSLSHPVLFMAATAVGEAETTYVHLSNTTRAALNYELVTPVGTSDLPCSLTVSPSIGTLQAGQTVRLQVKHAPQQGHLDAASSARVTIAADQHGSGDGGSNSPTIDGQSAQPDAGGGPAPGRAASTTATSPAPSWPSVSSQSALHQVWQLPIYTRPVVTSSVLEPLAAQATVEATVPPTIQSGLVLQVTTVTVPRLLSTDPRSLAFGQVPVGHAETQRIRVTNHSAVTLDLTPAPLNATGCFAIVNAPRTLGPGQYHDMLVSFKPTGHRVYTDRLVLGSAGHGPLMSVSLSGVGVSPQVELDPPGSGTIDFGAVCAGDTSTRKITLRNASAFSLTYNIRQLSSTPALHCPTPVPPFYVDPLEGSIPANGSATLSVTYAPRHAPAAGRQQSVSFIIDVPNQDRDAAQYLRLSGRCFDRAAYMLPAVAAEEIGEGSPGSVDSAIVSAGEDVGSQEMYTLVFPPAPPPTNTAVAAQPAASTAASLPPRPGSGKSTSGAAAAAATVPVQEKGVVKEMVISCINRADHSGVGSTNQVPTAFEVRIPATMHSGKPGSHSQPRPHCFSVDAQSGHIAPGQKQTLRFRFAPPEHPASASQGPAGASNAGAAGALSVGEWQEVDAVVVLRGGYVCEGAPADKEVTVRLKGLAQR